MRGTMISCVRCSRQRLLSSAVLIGLTAFLTLSNEQSHAQVVQQPTFSTFRVGSTVVVPDGGGALLGGISRGAQGSVERGVPGLGNIPYAGRLFRNRAIGRTVSSGNVSVHATIIDFEAMDKALLAEAERRRELRRNDPRFDQVAEPTVEEKDRAAFISRNIGRKRDQ